MYCTTALAVCDNLDGDLMLAVYGSTALIHYHFALWQLPGVRFESDIVSLEFSFTLHSGDCQV